jgi:hypothetical protein
MKKLSLFVNVCPILSHTDNVLISNNFLIYFCLPKFLIFRKYEKDICKILAKAGKRGNC